MPELQRLMAAAIRELLPQFLSPEKVEASFAVMGVDSQLIADGTYFVITLDGAIAGCGGWSRRATLFGGNHTQGRDARLLDPKTEAARVRAMYTSPDFARRGVGRRILELCETAARAEGFTKTELGATMGGAALASFGVPAIPATALAASVVALITLAFAFPRNPKPAA